MLQKQTTHLFKQLLDTISETEIVIEQQRHSLCHIAHFQPYSAFCRLDYQNRERISSHDLLQFFREQRISGISIGECARVVRCFDRDGDGLLTYEDFCSMVLTCS